MFYFLEHVVVSRTPMFWVQVTGLVFKRCRTFKNIDVLGEVRVLVSEGSVASRTSLFGVCECSSFRKGRRF